MTRYCTTREGCGQGGAPRARNGLSLWSRGFRSVKSRQRLNRPLNPDDWNGRPLGSTRRRAPAHSFAADAGTAGPRPAGRKRKGVTVWRLPEMGFRSSARNGLRTTRLHTILKARACLVRIIWLRKECAAKVFISCGNDTCNVSLLRLWGCVTCSHVR